MDDKKIHHKPRAVRRLLECHSCDEEDRRAWQTTSDSDTSQSDTQTSGCLQRRSSPVAVPAPLQRGYCSDSSPCKNLPPIGVFWDIENCQIPRGRSAVAVAQAIRDRFFDGHCEAEFLVVCDVKKETSQVIQELNDAQVNLIHVGSQCKNAADEKLRQSIRRFADLHGSLAAIVLITGDINFAPDLCDLRHRKKIHVILVHNDLCSESLILCANEHYRFSEIVANLPLRGTIKTANQPAEVTVTSLPKSCDPNKVRSRLKRLAENCGGRVGVVQGDLSTVRFVTLENAIRAQKRMDGEMVYGSRISVSHPTVLREIKNTSPQKNYNRWQTARRDDEKVNGFVSGENVSPWSDLATPFCAPRYYEGSDRPPPPMPRFNRENVPLSEIPAWNNGCNIPVTTHVQIHQLNSGRPILGRRNEPNHQQYRNTHQESSSGRHSLDSMMEGEMNGLKLQMFPSQRENFRNQYHGERRCRTPSPPSHFTNNQNQQNQYLFHPIPIKQTQTELLVTNLDQSIDLPDLRTRLTNLFTKHCPVVTVAVFVDSDGAVSARVKVPTAQDAQHALTRLKGHVIGRAQIHITVLRNRADNSPSPASSTEAVELAYCERHSRSPSTTQLPRVSIAMDQWAPRLAGLISCHDNQLPLYSLVDCYSATFGPLTSDLATNQSESVPLEHLVTCVPKIQITETPAGKILQVNNDPPKEEGNAKLRQLGRELIELLSKLPDATIPFAKLIATYRSHFSRPCRIADYGYSKLTSLLTTLNNYVQVTGEGEVRLVTLSHPAQMTRFATDLLLVLSMQPNRQASVQDLPRLWPFVIGRPLMPRDYGLCKLWDLLRAVPEQSVSVKGDGPTASLELACPEQTAEQKERTAKFTQQVMELLCATPNFSMDYTKFVPAYHHHFRAQCKVADYGFTKLIQLFESIPDIVKVEGDVDSRVVSLSEGEKLKAVAARLREMVAARAPAGMPFDGLGAAYQWQYGSALKPFDFHCKTMLEFVKKISTVKITVGPDGNMVLIPAPCQELFLRTLRVLWEKGAGRMALGQFNQVFQRYYHQVCPRQTIETELSEVVKITPDGQVQLSSLQLFARDVYRLLCSQGGRLALAAFEPAFAREMGAAVSPQQYGFATTLELLAAIDHVATVCGKGTRRLITLNTGLAAVGINIPAEIMPKQSVQNIQKKNGMTLYTGKTTTQEDINCQKSAAQALMKALNVKKTEGIITKSVQLNDILKGENAIVQIDVKNVKTNREKRKTISPVKPAKGGELLKGLKLLSPAEFLLPAASLHFHPAPPDPSTLPRPTNFTLTQLPVSHTVGPTEQCMDDSNDQNKRRLRLAAYFRSPIELK